MSLQNNKTPLLTTRNDLGGSTGERRRRGEGGFLNNKLMRSESAHQIFLYTISLQGIQKEIFRREQTLRARRAWLLDPVGSGENFTASGCYLTGIKIMYEIKKLKQIRYDLNDAINKLK